MIRRNLKNGIHIIHIFFYNNLITNHMKKTLFAMFAAALMMTGCSSDLEPEATGDGNVNFTVMLPDGMNSRAYADGTTATQLTYALYNEDGTYIPNSKKSDVTFENLKAQVSLNLITGKTYKIVFWAQAPTGAPYAFNENTGEITVTTTGDANVEARDAFFTCETVVVNGPIQRDVTLTRPFAQINIGTTDYEAFTAIGGTISKSGMKVKAYNTLNLLTGAASGEAEYTFTDATFPSEELTINGVTDLKYLTMNYILIGSDKETVDVTWTSDNTAKPEVLFASVPVQRNYRTNIYGALLSNPALFNIEISEGFNGEHTVIHDEEGYRIANSLEEANELLAKGTPAVSLNGELLTSGSAPSTQSLSRAGTNVVEFLLNKTIEHQSIKITGEAKADIKVSYGETTGTAISKPTFTLVVIQKAKNIEINLPGASVKVYGRNTTDNKSSIDNITISAAENASVDGTVTVDNIEKGDSFTGDVEFSGEVELGVTSPSDFINALTSDGVNTINVKDNIDLTSATASDLVINGGKTINVAGGVTITLPANEHLLASTDLSIIGIAGQAEVQSKLRAGNSPAGGIITNAGTTSTPHTAKLLVEITNGNLVIDNITLVNDMEHHYHGETNNSTAILHRNSANVTVKNSIIKSGEFALCAIPKLTSDGNIVLENSYFESNSSSGYGTDNWSYCVRLSGKTATLTNCEVKGIHGGVAPDSPLLTCTIKSGKYYTVNNEGKEDAFYTVYVTNGATAVIEGGEFFGANNHSALSEGTSCLVSGDNDTNRPLGNFIIKGGKFSGKAYNHVTGTVYQPESWVALENEAPYKWTVK